MPSLAVNADIQNALPSKRAEALRLGTSEYFTGKPCSHGHVTNRRTSNSRCIACDAAYYQANQEKLKCRANRRHHGNREEILDKRRQNRLDNIEFERAKRRSYYKENRERILAENKRYVERNKDKVRAKRAEWIEKNSEYMAEKVRNYMRERNQSDAMFNLRNRCRRRIHNALCRVSGSKARRTTESIIGCTIEELHSHIESQFSEGMTWANRSQWHIDHIMPLASADTEAEVLDLCHFTNLQPLWAEDNIRKSNHVQSLEV